MITYLIVAATLFMAARIGAIHENVPFKESGLHALIAVFWPVLIARYAYLTIVEGKA